MITGDNVLHLAVFENRTDFVRSVVSTSSGNGSDDQNSHALYEVDEINMKNEDGNTPLSYACIKGNLEIVKILHAKGAVMTHRNTAGLTPLLLSIYH